MIKIKFKYPTTTAVHYNTCCLFNDYIFFNEKRWFLIFLINYIKKKHEKTTQNKKTHVLLEKRPVLLSMIKSHEIDLSLSVLVLYVCLDLLKFEKYAKKNKEYQYITRSFEPD
jgi:hypothetical protein